MYAWTAAHPSLPLGTCVEVVNLNNGRHVFVRINDRGPYVAGRTIDLSCRAAQELRMVADGIAPVQIIHAKAEKCMRPREGVAFGPRSKRSGTLSANER